MTSLCAHLHDTAGATCLVTALPLTHLTSLTLSGTCGVSPAAAAALAAATALQDLTVPGKGLATSLAAVVAEPAAVVAEPAVLKTGGGSGSGGGGGGSNGGSSSGSGGGGNPAMLAAPPPGLAAASTGSTQSPSLAAGLLASLQHLCLTDGGNCSADDLRLLGQLKGLREVGLGYQPYFFDWQKYSADEDGDSSIAGEGWSVLPVISLEFGLKRFPGEGKLYDGEQDSWLNWQVPTVDTAVVDSLTKLTGLTRLAFGPTVGFSSDLRMPAASGPVPLLARMLQPLTSLQVLELTMDIFPYWDMLNCRKLFQLDAVSDHQWETPPAGVKGRAAVLRAVAQLPCLRRLKLAAGVCFGGVGDAGSCLGELAAAPKLVELEITGDIIDEIYELSRLAGTASLARQVCAVCAFHRTNWGMGRIALKLVPPS